MSRQRRRQTTQQPIPLSSSADASLQQMTWQNELLVERLAELELALEDQGWRRLTGEDEKEFSRQGLRDINRLARLFYLKNPLIQRGVDVQVHYVFGQGVNVGAENQLVNDVVQVFWDDAKNQAELTSHQSREAKERELQLFGNLFFVFFTAGNGRVRVRTINVDEIEDIITDPDDAKSPWFYRRVWQQQELDGESTRHEVLYPDWRYAPKQRGAPAGFDVRWDTPVYHVRTGGLSDMRFGVSEVYAALDWARAYKEFLEDWATLTRAYSRFAHKLTTPGGKAGVAAAKAKLATTYGNSGTGMETNPAPVVGSTFIAGAGTDISPMRIGGANVSAEDGRRLLLMVAAAVGLPESFFGDVSVGTLATAKSLDRPTELKMRSRQTLWAGVLGNILGYAVLRAVKAGVLKGTITEDDDGTPTIELETDPDTGEPRDPTVQVTFPPILEHDIVESISSIVDAATLKGSQPAGTIDERTVSRMLLSALGEPDVDKLLDAMYPEDYDPMKDEEPEEEPEEPEDGEVDPEIDGEETVPAAEAMMTEAVRELRDAVKGFVEKHAGTAAAA